MKAINVFFSSLVLLLVLLTGCGKDDATEKTSTSSSEAKVEKVTQVTNWYAQPDFGGQYAALAKGYYKEAALDMTIEPGGPQISEIQLVASGKAQFGMAGADDLLLARQEGIPVVAIAALYQTDPQVLLFHKKEDIKSFDDINNRTVYVAPGVNYWQYIQKKYDVAEAKEMAFTGQFGPFIKDKTSISQAFMTTAPYVLQKQGVDVDYLLVKDSGYQNYADVLFTTEDYMKEHPEIVQAYVQATLKGWDYYKTNYEEINEVILKDNPDLDIDAMKYSSEVLMDLVFEGDAAQHGVGYMSKDRWSELADQLTEIGALKEKINIDQVFTTEFLK